MAFMLGYLVYPDLSVSEKPLINPPSVSFLPGGAQHDRAEQAGPMSPRALWSPVLFALPSPFGFSPSITEERLNSDPSMAALSIKSKIDSKRARDRSPVQENIPSVVKKWVEEYLAQPLEISGERLLHATYRPSLAAIQYRMSAALETLVLENAPMPNHDLSGENRSWEANYF